MGWFWADSEVSVVNARGAPYSTPRGVNSTPPVCSLLPETMYPEYSNDRLAVLPHAQAKHRYSAVSSDIETSNASSRNGLPLYAL